MELYYLPTNNAIYTKFKTFAPYPSTLCIYVNVSSLVFSNSFSTLISIVYLSLSVHVN